MTLACHLVIGQLTQAQWQYIPTTGIEYHNAGFVGIGTSTPLVKLGISGDANVERIHIVSSQDPVVCMYHINGTTTTPSPVTFGNNLGYYQFGGYDGTQNIRSAWITGIASQNWTPTGRGAGMAFCTTPNNSTTMTERMRVDENGNVGIATTDTKGYTLAVNGNAIFNKVVVKAYPWPDYVFHLNYRLLPLSEVEQYINQYHHLPEVLSAEEVENNGLDVGDNQATLLKKIEELTLYVIEQDKQIKKLASENREMESLKKEMEALKAAIQQMQK